MRRHTQQSSGPAVHGDSAMLEACAQFTLERERIRIKKTTLGLSSPWTQDAVLALKRFANVRREHDATSLAMCSIFAGRSCHDPAYLFNVVLHRFLSKRSSTESMGYVTNLAHAIETLSRWEERFQDEKRRKVRNPFKWRNSAFMSCDSITQIQTNLCSNWKKSKLAGSILFGTSASPLRPTFGSGREILHTFGGVGEFHATQGTLDLVMYGAGIEPPSRLPPGPGAKRGLVLLGFAGTPEHLQLATDALNVTLKVVHPVDDEILGSEPLILRLHDTEHLLCEFQKYVRARLNGSGIPTISGGSVFYGDAITPAKPSTTRRVYMASSMSDDGSDVEASKHHIGAVPAARMKRSRAKTTSDSDSEYTPRTSRRRVPSRALARHAPAPARKRRLIRQPLMSDLERSETEDDTPLGKGVCCNCDYSESTTSTWMFLVTCDNRSHCVNPCGSDFHPECVHPDYPHPMEPPKKRKDQLQVLQNWKFVCDACQQSMMSSTEAEEDGKKIVSVELRS
ncbi:hypothetical protein DFJ77DRAFT_510143 [Powellomyces hirtus]|nr:hypothetical protein DFJ77DRAFT_510143 [Powellomyces hirtus]